MMYLIKLGGGAVRNRSSKRRRRGRFSCRTRYKIEKSNQEKTESLIKYMAVGYISNDNENGGNDTGPKETAA